MIDLERNADNARDMLRQAHLVTPARTEQALAMLTAVAVLIEQEVGLAAAPAAMLALIEPTLEHWHAQTTPPARR